jgi:serine/threonine protein kinase
MAPEILDTTKTSTSAVDVWALGAVTFCMCTGSPPFRDSLQLVKYHDGRTEFPIGALGNLSSGLKNFVRKTMSGQPELRLTIEQVLHDDWLASRTSGGGR